MATAHFERILCSTDFSPFSTQALRHALAIARQFGSRLKVIYVIPNLFPGGESIYGGAPWLRTPDFRQQAEKDMHDFLAPAREARINHEIEIRDGDPWREIVAVAEQMPADLVVLGTHGRSGLDHLFLGSVAEKLIRRLPCPVFTVSHEEGRTWAAPGLIGRILCATDFSEASSEALRLAVALAEKHHSEMTFLHVVETLSEMSEAASRVLVDVESLRQDIDRRTRERLQHALTAVGPTEARIEPRVAVGSAYKEILKIAAVERMDLIVIGAQGHSLLERMLSGSNAQHVIRAATCPVLTVRPAKVKPKAPGAQATGLTLAEPAPPTS